jgi:hypothetical protein
MVISDGKTKVAQYGQWDGYPQGQGKKALEFLHGCDLKKFKEKIDALSFLTDSECEKLDEEIDFDKKYPWLSRDAGAQILSAIYYGTMRVSTGIGSKGEVKVKVSKVVNSEYFAKDSLFCEYAYLIDLDKRTFEVYCGFNTRPLGKKQRFKYLEEPITRKVLTEKDKNERLTRENEYFPIRMVKSYDLDDLPTMRDFLYHFADKEEKEEIDSLERAIKKAGIKS